MSHGGGDDEADSLQIAAGDLPFLPSCNLIQLSEWREHTEREMMRMRMRKRRRRRRTRGEKSAGYVVQRHDRQTEGLTGTSK